MGGRRWQEILSELTNAHENNLPTISRQDLVGFCLENKTLRNSIDDYLKTIKVTGKDSVVALQKKEEGNKNFLQKKYEESLQSYTKTIFYANKDDEVLPLTYANRAFVLQKLDRLTESLVDIDMALATGYPKEKSEKLKLRKAKCLLELENKKKDESASKNCPKPEYQLPKLVGGENKDFASASAYLSVYFDENRGRHVIATKNIKLGEILFVEKAFAFVVCEQACAHCLKTTIAPIPCENCLDVTYCSLKCREDSAKAVHSFQCGFGDLFNSVGIAHLGLQIIIAASSNLDELKKKLNSISEPKYKNGPVQFGSKGYDSVYNLVHHSDDFEVKDLFQYTLVNRNSVFSIGSKNFILEKTALLLATYLKNHTNYFPAESGKDDLKLVTSTILRHILQMICNGHAIMEAFVRGTNNSMVLSKAEHRIATAIYPSVSMMNHSCQPSVIIGFYKNYMIVQAAKEIKKGEEVFNCYGADARRMERAQRQEILSKQYFFKCECQVCVQTFDLQDKFTAFKCSVCNGPSVQKDKTVMEAVCMDCGEKSEIPGQLISKVNNFYLLLHEGQVLNEIDIILSSRKYLEAWRLGREIFYKFHKDLSCAADKVAECFAKLGNFRKCASFLRCSVLSVEARFGFFSLELVQELNKFLEVQLAVLSTGMPSREDILKYIELHEKSQRIVQILDGNPYFKSEKITSLEELIEAYGLTHK